MGEEQDGRGNEIQPIGLPRQRRNDIKNQRQVLNIRNVFSCFEKGSNIRHEHLLYHKPL
jgi:hypothetical protein